MPLNGRLGSNAGWCAFTTVIRLEAGYSARSGPDLRAGLQRPPLSSMPVEYLTPAIEDRAMEILTLLADRGQHRAPSVPDLIIAATAEREPAYADGGGHRVRQPTDHRHRAVVLAGHVHHVGRGSAAIPAGPPPMGMVAVTVLVSPLITDTVSLPILDT
jgi:hypothetical protein